MCSLFGLERDEIVVVLVLYLEMFVHRRQDIEMVSS